MLSSLKHCRAAADIDSEGGNIQSCKSESNNKLA